MKMHENFGNCMQAAILASIPEPFFVIDECGKYIHVFGGVDRNKYHDGKHLIGKCLHEVIEKELADEYLTQIHKAIQAETVINFSYELSTKDVKGFESTTGPEGIQWFEAHISPIQKIEGKPRMVVWIPFNITQTREFLAEKDILIEQLKEANREIKTLGGLLPICAKCKSIRDDKGYWNQIESYIKRHSNAEFSHGLCPNCMDELYGDQSWYSKIKKKKRPPTAG